MKTEIIKLKKIKKIESDSFNYDVQVKDNHNFFANNLLVHNSMGIIFYFENEWRTATGGSFNSEQAIWAKNWMDKNINTSVLSEDVTYVAEVVYLENKIVVSYDYEGLVLLAGYNSDGSELTVDELKNISYAVGFLTPVIYDFNSLDKIVKTAKELDHNDEGYVIRFKSGVRVKIKGDEYVRVHRLISRVTPLAVWDMLLHKEDTEDIRKDLPEELCKDYDNILQLLKEVKDAVLDEIETLYEETKDLTDKELGLELQHQRISVYFLKRNFDKTVSFVFMRRKRDFANIVNDVDSLMRRKIFNIFRPTSNVLAGYKPSNVMNRFNTQDN